MARVPIANLKGPQGERGPEGLPGPGAVLADAATSAYVKAPTSQTRLALDSEFAARGAAYAPLDYPMRKVKWITTFAPGHGWVFSGATGAILDDTDRPVLGSSSLRFLCDQASGPAQITRTGMAPIDTTGKDFVLWLRTEDLSKIATITLFVGNDTLALNARYDTWNAASSTKPTVNGRWTPVYFDRRATSTAGAVNLAAVTAMRIRITATSAVSPANPLIVNLGGFGMVPQINPFYPKGVITFSFDDGTISQFTHGKRVLDKYGYPGTLYAIPELISTGHYMSLAQMKQMRDYSGWEIGGHAYSDRVHSMRITGVPLAEAEEDTAKLRGWLMANGFNSESYCYPGGLFNAETIAMLRRYFGSARTTVTHSPYQLLPTVDPMMLTQIDVGSTVASLKNHIDRAVEQGNWIIMMIHQFSVPGDGVSGTPVAQWEEIVDYVAASGIAVATQGEVIDRTRYMP